MTSIEIVGKKLSEAVELGAKELGVGINDVEYDVIDEGSKGFLGIGARPARILVKLAGTAAAEAAEAAEKAKEAEKAKQAEKAKEAEKAKQQKDKKPEKKLESKPERKENKYAKKAEKPEYKKPEAKAEPKLERNTEPKPEFKKREPKPVLKTPEAKPAAAEETKPAAAPADAEDVQSIRMSLTEEDKKIIIASAVDFLKEVFGAMNMQVELDVKFEDNKQILIEMSGSDMGIVIGKRGQTLDSLQYLTNLVVNKGSYPYMNVTLDTEGYRARRKETLEHLAFNLAKKAKHIRKNVVLEPMNPYERRIIHSTLQNDRYVTTYSEGTEPYRYVIISPKPNYRGGYRRNSYDRRTSEQE